MAEVAGQEGPLSDRLNAIDSYVKTGYDSAAPLLPRPDRYAVGVMVGIAAGTNKGKEGNIRDLVPVISSGGGQTEYELKGKLNFFS